MACFPLTTISILVDSVKSSVHSRVMNVGAYTLECAAIGSFPSTSGSEGSPSLVCRYYSMNNVIQVYSYTYTCQILKIELRENLLQPVGRECKVCVPLSKDSRTSISFSFNSTEGTQVISTLSDSCQTWVHDTSVADGKLLSRMWLRP